MEGRRSCAFLPCKIAQKHYNLTSLNISTLPVAGAEEEEAPASIKYGNEPLTVVGVSAVSRRGMSATLTCTFG